MKKQSIGTTTTVRANLALTGSFVNSDAIDLQNFDTANIEVVSVTNDAGKLAQFKYLWSADGTDYYPEKQVEAAAGGSGIKINTAFDKVFSCPLDTAGKIWSDRVERQNRFLIVSIREAAGVSTATLAIKVTPMNKN